jgi:superfamily II DNA or RNA helicase
MCKTYLAKRGYVIKKKELTEEEIKEVKDDLTVSPAISTDFGAVADPFPIYLENEKKLYVPKFYGIEKFGEPSSDKVPPGADINVDFKFTIRPNQELPVKRCMEAYQKKGGGILSLSCGQGKTIIGLYLISQLKKKTLVIVHKEFLLNQWVERIEQALPDAKIGRIQQSTYDVEGKDIVIGMLQTISMKEFSLIDFDCFGHVIIDEAHRIPSQVFSKALQKINCPYMLGLSATPNRKDGLTKVLKWYVGNIVYTNKTSNTNNVLVNRYIVKSQNPVYNQELYDFRGRVKMATMINNITEYFYRTKIIINVIKEILKEDNRKILLLSDRKNHLNDIYKFITTNNICTVGYYVGGMKKEKLKESEYKDLILGTFAMANEGLDIEALNTLILASPKSDIIQSCGRILRKSHGEVKPIIVDMVDNFSMFENQGNKRLKYYRSKKYDIMDYEVQDISGEILSEKKNEVEPRKKKTIKVDTSVCLF